MKNPTTNSISNNLLEFMMLYHRKFASFFHKPSNSHEPLNKNQKKVLLILKHHQGVSHTFLSKGLDLQKGSLTTLIDSLEEMELVKRETDPQDRRRVHLFLTKKGDSAIGAIMEGYSDYLQQLFSRLSVEEREEFQRNLENAITIIRKIGE